MRLFDEAPCCCVDGALVEVELLLLALFMKRNGCRWRFCLFCCEVIGSKNGDDNIDGDGSDADLCHGVVACGRKAWTGDKDNDKTNKSAIIIIVWRVLLRIDKDDLSF